MSKDDREAAARMTNRTGTADVHVSPLVTMTLSETLAILNNPYGLRLLMDHVDLQYSQAESMLEPGEIEPWPTKRFQALREKGRSIIAEDPELWDDDIKREFGLPCKGESE